MIYLWNGWFPNAWFICERHYRKVDLWLISYWRFAKMGVALHHPFSWVRQPSILGYHHSYGRFFYLSDWFRCSASWLYGLWQGELFTAKFWQFLQQRIGNSVDFFQQNREINEINELSRMWTAGSLYHGWLVENSWWYLFEYPIESAAYCGWLRNPAPLENGGLYHYRVSTNLLVVQENATIHHISMNYFVIELIARPGLEAPHKLIVVVNDAG